MYRLQMCGEEKIDRLDGKMDELGELCDKFRRKDDFSVIVPLEDFEVGKYWNRDIFEKVNAQWS